MLAKVHHAAISIRSTQQIYKIDPPGSYPDVIICEQAACSNTIATECDKQVM